jgi:hypothetical protein
VYHFFINYLNDIPAVENILNVRYAIQYNRTEVSYRGKDYDPVFMWEIPMQKAVEREICMLYSPQHSRHFL